MKVLTFGSEYIFDEEIIQQIIWKFENHMTRI